MTTATEVIARTATECSTINCTYIKGIDGFREARQSNVVVFSVLEIYVLFYIVQHVEHLVMEPGRERTS